MDLEHIKQNLPYLNILSVGKETYVGIIQNSDEKVISFYDFGVLRSVEDQKRLLDLACEWWNESNRLLPISVFLSEQMSEFRYALKSTNAKETTVVCGPIVSLAALIKKRVKRKQVELVRKM